MSSLGNTVAFGGKSQTRPTNQPAMFLVEDGPGPRLLTPAERLDQRRTSSWSELALAGAFFLFPAALVVAALTMGSERGIFVYRVSVSWVCTWAMLVTLLDPFLIRYRLLGRTLPHFESTFRAAFLQWATCRPLSLYIVLVLFSVLIAVIEQGLAEIWGETVARRAISLLIAAGVYLGVLAFVVWLAADAPDLYLTHTNANANTNTSTRTNQTNILMHGSRFADEKQPAVVRVHLTDDRKTSSSSSSSASASTTGPTPTSIATTVLSPESVQLAHEPEEPVWSWSFRSLPRSTLFAMLVAGLIVLAALQTAYTTLLGSEPWLLLVCIVGFAVITCIVIWTQRGKALRRARVHRAFFQMFQVLSTLVPILFGSWLVGAYRARAPESQQTGNDALLLLLQMVFSQTHFWLTYAAVSRLSAPYTYARLLLLPQLTGLFTQHALFGLLPWSASFVVLAILASVHNVIASVNGYWRVLVRLGTCVRIVPDSEAESTAGSQETETVRRLLESGFAMQLFSQECMCDVLSLATLSSLVYVAPWLATSLLPAFTRPYLALRFGVLLLTRAAGWLVTQQLFTSKLAVVRDEVGDRPIHVDTYLRETEGVVSVSDKAELLSTLEEDIPELFAYKTAAGAVAELAAWRASSFDSVWLRKNAAYFLSCFFLLSFIILQRDAKLPLRLAWWVPQSES